MTEAKAAAANVVRRDPDWTVEKYLSDGGGYPEDVAILFIEGARKAGVAACVPVQKIPGMPDLFRLKTCDKERVRQAAGVRLPRERFLLNQHAIALNPT